MNISEYGLSHRPGNPLAYPDEVITADRITDGKIFPKDFLEHADCYLDMSGVGAKDVLLTLRKIQGDPDGKVTVFRGAPSGGVLNQGDWVTLSKEYAGLYAKDAAYSDNADSKVYSYVVRAGDLSFDGDDIREFGYWGEKMDAK